MTLLAGTYRTFACVQQSALGHTSITIDEPRYLGVTEAGLQKSFERFERHCEAPASVLEFKRSGV